MPHIVIQAAAGKDHVGMIANLLRLVRKIIGIDTYTVATDEPRMKGKKVPLGTGCLQNLRGMNS